jgi:hypothetical protein
VDLHEVVPNEVERQRVAVIVEFLRERICESRKTTHLHPHREIVPLGIDPGDHDGGTDDVGGALLTSGAFGHCEPLRMESFEKGA